MWWKAYCKVQTFNALTAPIFVLVSGLFLSIFSYTSVAIAHSEPLIHGKVFPVTEPLWILEIRTTTVVRRFKALEEEFDSQIRERIVEIDYEEALLLKKLQKPEKNTGYTTSHLRYRLLSAIEGFQRFGKIAETRIQLKRESYGKLSHWQKQVRTCLLISFLVELRSLIIVLISVFCYLASGNYSEQS